MPHAKVKYGVVLAGGTGSRLRPFTEVTNKHLLPVGDVPMIDWSIKLLIAAGIRDIMVITGTEHAGNVFAYVGSGVRYDANLTFRVQEKADGIAGAVSLARDFCSDEFIVVLADNIIADSANTMNIEEAAEMMCLSETLALNEACRVFFSPVEDPRRFGVGRFDDLNGLVEIIEKPDVPPSDMAMMGVYHFTPNIFHIIDGLVPSARGEYEITEAVNYYLKNGIDVAWEKFDGFWSDAGTHDSYQRVNELVRQSKISKTIA